MAGLSRASAWMSVSGVFPSPSRFSARPSPRAYFGQNEKEATRKAGEYANLDVISILPEPTAAALAYVNGMKIRKRTERIFVFDLGGGTFDVTILEVSNGDRKNIEAKRCDGDSKLGGADWDETIVNYMVNRFYSVNKVNLLYEEGEGGVFLGGDEGSVDEAFDRNRKPLAYRMLSKNQPYPCEFKQKFPIQSPNQSTVNVTVLEGEDDDPEYCRAIGTSKLPLVGEHGRDDLVEVSFSVDMNGILQVYAIDLKSGERIDVEIDRNDGFNETAESVRKAAEDAAEFDVFLG